MVKGDQTLSLHRWKQLCRRLGIVYRVEQEFNRIAAAYGEPQRVYHTAQHINECLDLLDWAMLSGPRALLEQPTLEMALWYHDVVYQPHTKRFICVHQACGVEHLACLAHANQ